MASKNQWCQEFAKPGGNARPGGRELELQSQDGGRYAQAQNGPL